MANIDFGELRRISARSKDTKEQIINTTRGIRITLNNISSIVNSNTLDTSNKALNESIYQLHSEIITSLVNLENFLDTQLDSYQMALEDALISLASLISTIDQSFGGTNSLNGSVSFNMTNIDSLNSINSAIDSAIAGQEIISIGMKYLGTPYVYGGSNLNTSVDCSGFINSVLTEAGYDISVMNSNRPEVSNYYYYANNQAKQGNDAFILSGGIDANGNYTTISSNARTKESLYSLANNEDYTSLLQNGDIILYKEGGWSHMGFIVKDETGVRCLQSAGNQVSLNDKIRAYTNYCVIRPSLLFDKTSS